MPKLKKMAAKAAKIHWFAHHKPLVIVSCFILVALIAAIFVMWDKNNNQYLYGNVMNVDGSSSKKQVNPNIVPLDKRRSDLYVSKLSVDRWNCYNGMRQVLFNFVEGNLSLFTSSEFYTVLYQNGDLFAAGYGSYSTIPGATQFAAWFGWLLQAWWTGWTGWQWVNIQVSAIPVNHILDETMNRQDALNTYTNRNLDANPANNTMTQMVYVNPCP